MAGLRARAATRILAVSAVVLVAVLGAFAVELARSQAHDRSASRQRFAQRAQVAAALTEALFASVDSPATQAENARRFGATVQPHALRAAVAQGHLAFAAVVGPGGRLIAAAPRLRRGAAVVLAAVARPVLRGAAYELSGTLAPVGQRAPVVALVQAVPSASGTRALVNGVPVAALAEFLRGYLSKALPISAGAAYVIDARGRVVGASMAGVAAGGLPTQPGLAAAVGQRWQGGFGHDGYVVAARVAHTPWRVVLTTTTARLGGQTGAQVWLPWLLLAAFAAVGVIALLLLRGVLASAESRLSAANTRLRDVNRRLEQANQELEDRAGELARSNAELARSNAELDQFAAIASHDLQEPLRKVMTFAAQLQEHEAANLSPRGADHLRRMSGAAERMQTLIQDLLELSRVSTRTIELGPVDLREVAEEVIEDLEVAVREAAATVRVEPLPTVHADPVQMRQLLQNLVSNAVKFRRTDVPLEVRVGGRTTGEWAELTVADNGIGFEAQYAGRIFLVFERLHGAGAYPGNGMGLALCRRIVARHGGEIRAEGRPQAGARFVVRLPRSAAPPPLDVPRGAPAARRGDDEMTDQPDREGAAVGGP